MKPTEITDSVYYVGVNDRQKDLFENMLPLPYGVSYNSYLICDEKTVLVDTVEQPYAEQLVGMVQSVLGERKLDYLIVNHMEPDHSSGMKTLRTLYPDMQIIANCKTIEMIGGYYGICDGFHEVKDGESLTIGKNTLSFHFAPMVHWPEVMVTYMAEKKLLFSADAFGCFGTLDGAVIDTQLNLDKYYTEMVRYYACIVGKYGAPVQTALKKLGGLDIQMICSTHGPIWTKHIPDTITIYDRLSKYETEPGVVIAYGSMYGHTEQMAEMVARGAATVTKNVVLHDVSRSDVSYILADIFRYNSLVIGSPTYCGELYPGVASLLAKIKTRGIKNHNFASFGSFTWADATCKAFGSFAEQMNWHSEGTVSVRQSMTGKQADELFELGRKIALKSIGK